MPEKKNQQLAGARSYEGPRLEPVMARRGIHERLVGTTDSWNLVCAACSNAN
jgi:hypothetical protein